MATLNAKTETEALVARFVTDAQDTVEARTMLFTAMMVMQQAAQQTMQNADEAKAALVLAARAAAVGGKTVLAQKADAALILGKHPSTVSAIETLEVVIVVPKG